MLTVDGVLKGFDIVQAQLGVGFFEGGLFIKPGALVARLLEVRKKF